MTEPTKFAKLLTLTVLTISTMPPIIMMSTAVAMPRFLLGCCVPFPRVCLGASGGQAHSGRLRIAQCADSQSHFRILLEQQGFFAIRAGCGQYDQHGDRITGAARAVHDLSFDLLVLLFERNFRPFIECV